MYSKLDNYEQHSALLLLNTLFANVQNNPRSLKIVEARQLMLGNLYENLIQTPGAFLSKREISSHISAAETDKRVAFIGIKAWTQLFQLVRPGGWLGDYYAGVPTVTASELGASPFVTDPNNEQEIVERVHVTLIVIADGALPAAVTTAKPVLDTWSIKGQEIDTCGGGEQYYFPLVSAAKRDSLVMLKPDNASPETILALQAIADKNGINLLSHDEIVAAYGQGEFQSPYSRASIAPKLKKFHTPVLKLEVQTAMNSAMHRGAWHELIELLEKSLQSPLDQAILGSLCGLVGRISDAQTHLNSFIAFYENTDSLSFKATYKEVYHYARHHFGLNATTPEESIAILENLKVFINDSSALVPHVGSSSSGSFSSNAHLALLDLDLAIRYNQLAAKHADELTFDDFDEDGVLIDHKLDAAKLAEQHVRAALTTRLLPLPEQIVAQTELGFSLKKQRKPIEALNALLTVQDQLATWREFIDDPHSLKDLDLQHLSIRLAIGLTLCRCDNPALLPPSLRTVSRIDYLDALHQDLASIDRMSSRLLFNRWLGRNESDLFLVGWHERASSSNQERGTRLIQFYREIFPLEIDKICDALRENRITKLDLSYLGEAPPTGINNDDFKKLMSALAANTSLKKLYLRKCANSTDPVSEPYRRLPALANALATAQKSGQALTYLSYSGTRYRSDEALAMVAYLAKNKSLIVLQPSLYDIKSLAIFERYAQVIQKHPMLTTLLTGILTSKGAGSVLGKACERAKAFKYLHPFPRALRGGQYTEQSNNEALLNAKNNIDLKDCPIRAAHFAALKKEINAYNLSFSRRSGRFYSSQRNRPGQRMSDIINKMERGDYSFDEGIKLIRAQSKILGNPHPIYTAALNCLQIEQMNDRAINVI